MHNVRLFIQRIARANHVLFVTDGEFEFARQHIGQLFVRVVVHRADSALFEVHLNGHHFAIVRENAAGYAIAQIFKGGFFMKNKHQAILFVC